MTHSDAAQTGVCTDFCGWHIAGDVNNNRYKYALIPMPAADCCFPQWVSPNGNERADGMVNVIAHELTETATNPLGTGYYFDNGDETGDHCQDVILDAITSPDQSMYNIQVGGLNYYIQANFNLKTQTCSMA